MSSHAKFMILTVIALTVLSCRPRWVLSPSEMEDLLYELHKADGVVYVQGWKYGHDSLQTECYSIVMQKHNTTQAQFDSSLVWYTAHPIAFGRIYPRVMTRLNDDKSALAEQEQTHTLTPIKRQHHEKMRRMEDVLHENLHGFQPLMLKNQ